MTNTPTQIPKRALTRRSILAGGASAIAAISAVPSGAFAFSAKFGGNLTVISGRKRTQETTLAKYLCESVHNSMAERLDDVISDPAIDGERTALALMEARCPGCGERVHPRNSALSAVIPQWKSPITNSTTGVNA